MSTKFTLWIIDDKWMIVWYYDAYQDKNTCRLKLGTQKKNKVGNSEILFLNKRKIIWTITWNVKFDWPSNHNRDLDFLFCHTHLSLYRKSHIMLKSFVSLLSFSSYYNNYWERIRQISS